jgi:hypothetical protein
LVHDLGRSGVPNTIWDKPGPLTFLEWERVRLHPYYTERVLARIPALAWVAAIAVAHHEQLDGSGYHRGLSGGAIGPSARLLAAADAYQAMTQRRAHRPPLSAEHAASELRADVRAGRLAGDAVEAVLHAAGRHTRRRPTAAAGLTAREIQVLALLARGASNRSIASSLNISAKSVGTMWSTSIPRSALRPDPRPPCSPCGTDCSTSRSRSKDEANPSCAEAVRSHRRFGRRLGERQ